jgi:hypothetical protein
MSVLATYITVKFAFVQRHPYAITCTHCRSTPDDGCAIGIPADRVPSRKHAERTEVFQPAGERCHPRICAVTCGGGSRSKPPLSIRQARPHRGDMPPQITRLES